MHLEKQVIEKFYINNCCIYTPHIKGNMLFLIVQYKYIQNMRKSQWVYIIK